MWDIVWVSPQGHRSVSVSRHFLLQAPQCPCSVRKWFSRDRCCRGRSKPGCRIVGSHILWLYCCIYYDYYWQNHDILKWHKQRKHFRRITGYKYSMWRVLTHCRVAVINCVRFLLVLVQLLNRLLMLTDDAFFMSLTQILHRHRFHPAILVCHMPDYDSVGNLSTVKTVPNKQVQLWETYC